MNKQQAQAAAQAAADQAQNCHVVWFDTANNVWPDPADHGCADSDWVCALKGDYPGAVSWTVVL